ncbi:MAG TPA: SxtJ family membrane protein [Terriglobia bacterium]|nr:SxtJ family membrane protein [Terriglobia bacterium]
MALVEINRNPSRRDLRQFAGLWLPGFILLVGLLAWHRWGFSMGTILLGVAGVIISGLALFWPSLARVLYISWMYAAYPIGLGISLCVFAIVYFVILTPVGLTMRMLGRRPLDLKFDRSASTYWTARPRSIKLESYFRQF